MKKKLLIAVAAMALIVACVVGGSLAYLFVGTAPVVNTFEYGDINITLTESENLDLKMIPGSDIEKDPVVTVSANSEACWLFVKIEESANFDTFMTYEIDDGWTQGNGTDIPADVYYRDVPATEDDTEFAVLKDNKVLVKASVLKTDLNALTESTMPTLTFTAYAVQRANVADAAAAWAIAQNNGSPANS